jgi:hypothetical protein
MKAFQITPINIENINFEIIDTSNNSNITILKNTLNNIKSQLDDIYLSSKYYAKCVMKTFDPFVKEKYKIAYCINTYNLTNAWLKGYEIIDYFKLIPIQSELFVYFDNASFPGNFINATNHYVKTQTNIKNFRWYGASLLSKDNLGDDFNLKKNYPENWLINENNNGDITNISNIMDFQKQLNSLNVKVNNLMNETESLQRTVNLYSCDLALDWGNDYNNQESISFNANLCQILCGLLTLTTDGHMFVKHFTLFEPFTISYLSLLTALFKEVYISKPITSKRTNSEVYIVCKYYKYPFEENSMECKIINLFITKVQNLSNDMPFISNMCIAHQISSIIKSCENIYNTQIIALNQFINITNNKLYKNNNNMINKIKLNQINFKIINAFKKINIKPINKLDNLIMI